MKFLLVLALPLLAATWVQTQVSAETSANSISTNTPAVTNPPPRARTEFNRPITLTADDKPAFPDPAAMKQKLKLLWLACGNKDGLINISQGVHAWLKENNVPHIWHIDSNAHDPTEWRNNLYWFAQHIFR